VCRFKLGEDGSTFTSREQVEVIKTNHPAFRPIDVKMGPDGAIYIADWYNPIIQHGEVDFRDPRRDHVHGRIWRITAKGRPLVQRPNLVGAKTPELLDHLKDAEEWTRRNAKRVLKERGAKDVVPALEAWVKGLDPKDPGYEHHLLEALWTYQSLDVVEPILLNTLLNTKDYHARAAAVRVLGDWHTRIPNAIDLLGVRAVDDAPRVRMEAVRALAATGSPAAVAPAFAAMDKPVDRTMDYALWLTARDLEPIWMAKFKAGEDVFRGNLKGLTFALQAVGTASAAQPLLALARSGKLPKDREPAFWELIARTGGPAELRAVAERVGSSIPDSQRVALMVGLEESARTRGQRPAGDPVKDLTGYLLSFESAMTADPITFCRLVGLWKAEPFSDTLVGYVRRKDFTPAVRKAAVESLAMLGDARSRQSIVGLADPRESLEVRQLAVCGLASLDINSAAQHAADVLAAADAKEDPADLFAAFLARKGGSAALAKALDGKKLNPDVAKLGLKAVRSSVQDAKPLADALTKAGGLSAARTDYTPAEVKAYVDEVLSKGDAARGELVYRRKDATCLSCHAIAGAGGQVGPDMTSIGASAQVDYLVESILMPNKAVKEGYHALRVSTLEGKQYVGIKTREADGKLYLRTSEDKEIAVSDKDIDEKAESRSLMPDGLADQLTRQEFVDLVRFLSELGKVGPYAPNKARLVRRWQVIEPSRENIFVIQRNRAAAAVDNPDAFTWSAAYSKANGEFPLDSLPKLVVWSGSEPFGLVRAQFDVTTGGPVKFKVNGAAGLTLWVGAAPVEVKDETVVDLKPGLQALTFSVDLNKRRDALRLELEDVAGSPARVNIVNGK
jgi:putative heme-binding domain-containing protein